MSGQIVRNLYKTERLALVLSHPALAMQVLDYILRNRGFLEIWEPSRTPAYYTGRYQRQELKEDQKKAKMGTNVRFWLRPMGEEKIIGMVALNAIIMGTFCSAYLSYKLDKAYTRRGLMREALQKVIEIAFEEIGLHRLEANILPRNTASLGLVTALGFKEEGLARKYLQIHGQWEDHIHMTLLNE